MGRISMSESDFCKWIEKKNITPHEQTAIEEVIKAFSEFICAVDQEYQYNKTFLNGFIDSFVDCTKMLQEKKKCMLRIINGLKVYKESIVINIDDVWIYEGKKETENKNPITLSKSFNRWNIKSNKTRYQIRYIQIPEFVIAGTIDMAKEAKEIQKVLNLFNERIKKDENKGL